jgi:hypothetical protein
VRQGFRQGKAASAVDCIAADAKQKVAKARGGLDKVAAKRCSEAPSFGPRDASAVAAAAVAGTSGLLGELLGGVDATLARESTEPERSACQQAIVRTARKCHEARLAEFNRCKRAGLKDGSITSAAALGPCLAADAKGQDREGVRSRERRRRGGRSDPRRAARRLRGRGRRLDGRASSVWGSRRRGGALVCPRAHRVPRLPRAPDGGRSRRRLRRARRRPLERELLALTA